MPKRKLLRRSSSAWYSSMEERRTSYCNESPKSYSKVTVAAFLTRRSAMVKSSWSWLMQFQVRTALPGQFHHCLDELLWGIRDVQINSGYRILSYNTYSTNTSFCILRSILFFSINSETISLCESRAFQKRRLETYAIFFFHSSILWNLLKTFNVFDI